MFKKGEIVTGNKYSDEEYYYTNSNAICEVLRDEDKFGVIIVKKISNIVKSDTARCSGIGATFDVQAKYFEYAFVVDVV